MENEINKAHEAEKEDNSNESSERKIVVPGEIIVSGEDFLPGDGTNREGSDVIARKYGLAEISGRLIKVISLSGAFIPRRNNVVIGRVTGVLFNGWLLDIDSANSAFLPVAESPRFIRKDEMADFLPIGSIISAKIWSTNGRSIDLSLKGKGLGKMDGGFTFRVNPSRVPRIIGREGSMVNLIKEKTSCNITVGQNGWIWVKGDSIDEEIRARKAVEFVADKVTLGGLTEKMEEWFQQN
tara:strand:- start:242 stop:958 length:717 start_codon:yes stop_codon:yes gene_type:complete